jgi:hypothetical protein
MATSAEIRDRLKTELRLDLVGPGSGDDPALSGEVLPDPPSRWYLTGFLVPVAIPAKQCVKNPAATGNERTFHCPSRRMPGPIFPSLCLLRQLQGPRKTPIGRAAEAWAPAFAGVAIFSSRID